MSTLQLGGLYALATFGVLFFGVPIAFALGGVATVFMLAFMPLASLDTVAQNVYQELASITLLTIPLFILKGAAIGKSRAGKDLIRCLAHMAAPGARRAWCGGGAGLRAVRSHGRVEPRDLFGDRQLRHSGDAPAWLFARVFGGAGRGRRDARDSAPAFDRADLVRGRRGAVARTPVPRRAWSRRAAHRAFRGLCRDALAKGIWNGGRGRGCGTRTERDPPAPSISPCANGFRRSRVCCRS